MIHRRALITGLLASVAAPALARLMQGVTTVYYTPYVGDGVALPQSLIDLAKSYREMRERIYAEVFNSPYRDPSLPITTPRQIRT